MKRATGFITNDGTFFESEQEATLYEAEVRLRAKLGDVQESFLSIALNNLPELRSYINAHDAASNSEAEVESEAEGQVKPEEAGHVSGTEQDLEELLRLPRRVAERVGVGGAVPSKQRRKSKITEPVDAKRR